MENSQHEGNKNSKRAAKRIKTSNLELLEPNRKGSLFFFSGRNNNLITECQVRPSELQVEQNISKKQFLPVKIHRFIYCEESKWNQNKNMFEVKL